MHATSYWIAKYIYNCMTLDLTESIIINNELTNCNFVVVPVVCRPTTKCK